MTRNRYASIQFRNNAEQFGIDAADRAAAKADRRQHDLEGRTSRSGRTQIWTATPTVITVRYTTNTGCWRYREIPI